MKSDLTLEQPKDATAAIPEPVAVDKPKVSIRKEFPDNAAALFLENKEKTIGRARQLGIRDPEYFGTGVLIQSLFSHQRTEKGFEEILYWRIRWDGRTAYANAQREPLFLDELPEDAVSDAVDGGSALIRKERCEYIRSLVQRLPAAYRELVRLNYQKGLGSLEISEQTGIPYPVVRLRLMRARRKLAWLIAEEAETAAEFLPELALHFRRKEPETDSDKSSEHKLKDEP